YLLRSLGEGAIIALEARSAKRDERGSAEDGNAGEGEAAVARQLEGEACERRAGEDREDGAGVHERDRCSRCIWTRALGCGDDRGGDEAPASDSSCEHAAERAREDAHCQDQAPREPCCGRVHALALEQRDDPVPCDYGEPEGRGLERSERKEPAIAKHPLTGM